jgi:hypothetical protein
VPVAFGAFQPGQFGIGTRLVDQERVPGGQGLDLAEGHGGVTGLPGLVSIRSTADELISERAFLSAACNISRSTPGPGDVAKYLDLPAVVNNNAVTRLYGAIRGPYSPGRGPWAGRDGGFGAGDPSAAGAASGLLSGKSRCAAWTGSCDCP